MEIIATEKTKNVIVLARDLQSLWDGIDQTGQDETFREFGYAEMAQKHIHSLEKVMEAWVVFSIMTNMETDSKGNIHI